MSGDPKNAAVWANADVYIGPLTAKTPGMDGTPAEPSGDPFGVDWKLVGLLNGDDGFAESMSVDSNDHYAWGGLLVATTRQHFKLTRTFTALEDNETVFDLVFPGSDVDFDANGGYAGQLAVPDLQAKFKIAFQTQNGDLIKRVVSRNYAQVDERGDSTESESELATRPITVAIYPDPSGVLFDTYKGPATTP